MNKPHQEKRAWWKESVVYQIYPRSFKDANGDGIGDLRGITEKLDYIQDLGANVIWICPMYKSPNDDNGYDISDYQTIMEEFGTMDDFDVLLEETHKRGMKLILDLVINHTSDEHPWFIESRSSKNSPKRDWYIWRDGKEGKEPNNWESIFGGSAWEYDPKTDQYYLHLFSKKQPDLNWENEEVRKALQEMVLWWLDKGIDGFRIDAISHIKKKPGLPDMPNPKGLRYVPAFPYMMNVEGIDEFLKEFSEKTFKKYDIMTVGEANGVKIEDAERWVGEDKGYFNMIFQFEHLELWDKGIDKGVDVRSLKKTLTRWQKELEGKGWNALFIENHDQPRSVSTWGDDQRYWKESAKMLGAMYFFMKGTPYIYQGQEIGMTNVKFPNIEDYNDVGMRNFYELERKKGRAHQEIMEVIWKKGRDNSRTPMQWSGKKMAGFTTADKSWLGINPNYRSINVEKQLEEPDSILNFYKKMIRLRKEYDLFVYGTYDLLFENDPHLFVYTRTFGNDQALIICNFHVQTVQFVTPTEFRSQPFDLLLANYSDVDQYLPETFDLRPYETRIYLRKSTKEDRT